MDLAGVFRTIMSNLSLDSMSDVQRSTSNVEHSGITPEIELLQGPPQERLRRLKGEKDVCIVVPPFDCSHRYLPFHFDEQNEKQRAYLDRVTLLLSACAETVRDGGLLFLYGLPHWLPHFAVVLNHYLEFKHWVAIKTQVNQPYTGLKPEHMGLLIYAKGSQKYTINQLRLSHPICRACGDTVKDGGGKRHLMNASGRLLSDIWTDLDVDESSPLPQSVLERIVRLSTDEQRKKFLIVAPLSPSMPPPEKTAAPVISGGETSSSLQIEDVLDQIHHSDCISFLQRLPGESVDLLFADPPYNLEKRYNGYSDSQGKINYIRWCNRWLKEYVRLLKSGGSLFILNLPRWAVYHAEFLNRYLHLQRWIVWDALAEPRGKLLPAHYALLYYTKGPRPKVFNYRGAIRNWYLFDEAVAPPDAPDLCPRPNCIRKRWLKGENLYSELSDIWRDLHRVRHKRNRDPHPCQLPERMMERIIRMATNRGHIVLDCFGGAGTTAMVASRLGRHFITMEQDAGYVDVAQRKIDSLRRKGFVERRSVSRSDCELSKRKLQLELKRLALALGRLPERSDVEELSCYSLSDYDSLFPRWGEALKAAKLVDFRRGAPQDGAYQIKQREEDNQLELF